MPPAAIMALFSYDSLLQVEERIIQRMIDRQEHQLMLEQQYEKEDAALGSQQHVYAAAAAAGSPTMQEQPEALAGATDQERTGSMLYGKQKRAKAGADAGRTGTQEHIHSQPMDAEDELHAD
jgi:hypothetical protein